MSDKTTIDLMGVAQAELKAVEAQIKAAEERRRKLIAFVATGRELFGGRAPAGPVKGDSMARVVELAREYLAAYGVQPLGKIRAYIEAAGVVIGQDGKGQCYLSTYLSQSSDIFVSYGKKIGWGLRAAPAEVTPKPAKTATT